MGISMGGATAIHAVADGAQVKGLILLDPLLDTWSTFARGGWAETGIPPAFFLPAAWAATAFYELPGASLQAAERAAGLQLPILLLQDPDDPVTLARYAHELAARNDNVRLWIAPAIDNAAPEHAWKGRWGSHVAAFTAFPDLVTAEIRRFIDEQR
jgi:pimeloyl-ACP methyl ester carboxylesterase